MGQWGRCVSGRDMLGSRVCTHGHMPWGMVGERCGWVLSIWPGASKHMHVPEDHLEVTGSGPGPRLVAVMQPQQQKHNKASFDGGVVALALA